MRTPFSRSTATITGNQFLTCLTLSGLIGGLFVLCIATLVKTMQDIRSFKKRFEECAVPPRQPFDVEYEQVFGNKPPYFSSTPIPVPSPLVINVILQAEMLRPDNNNTFAIFDNGTTIVIS